MSRSSKHAPRFAICIKAAVDDMLTVRRVYQILPDAKAAKSSFLRVIDDEGEDYLYPASHFVILELPTEVERALEHAV